MKMLTERGSFLSSIWHCPECCQSDCHVAHYYSATAAAVAIYSCWCHRSASAAVHAVGELCGYGWDLLQIGRSCPCRTKSTYCLEIGVVAGRHVTLWCHRRKDWRSPGTGRVEDSGCYYRKLVRYDCYGRLGLCVYRSRDHISPKSTKQKLASC